jgi:hypothetical protein
VTNHSSKRLLVCDENLESVSVAVLVSMKVREELLIDSEVSQISTKSFLTHKSFLVESHACHPDLTLT